MRVRTWLGMIAMLCGILALVGCGSNKGAAGGTQGTPPTLVRTFTAFSSDTPVREEYTGSIAADQEVPIAARVTGYIVEKYIQGGERVEAGQALYRIDSRQYRASYEAARAQTAQARANYESALQDLERYRNLIAQDAISEQEFTRQQALVEQYRAMVEAQEAQASIASDNVDDTIVRAPFSGILGLDDLPVGNFVAAGQTPLVTISASDPILVRFDITEAQYLRMAQRDDSQWGDHLQLRLSDGSLYPQEGSVVAVDQGATGGGSFSVKARFDNPNHLLRPGMFVRLVSDAEIAKNSVLVPRQAVQPLLDKQMILVVDAENKVTQRPVQIGADFGPYVVVTDGLQAGETVIVEGQVKAQNGMTVQPQMVTREDVEKAAAAPAAQ